MLFNSLPFLLFFVIVTVSYFLLPHRARWLLLLVASCVFYMFFKPEYILILAFTIIIDYYAGILLENEINPYKRKRYLVMSLVANIGILAVFKYYNFINDNITGLAGLLHTKNHIPALRMLLPIGLSFHTFQAMSYTMEVYRGNQKAERHFGIYSLYVMFYPQLVAGPIERPQNLLHQFRERHNFNSQNLIDGLRLMLWGFFKKVVIADRVAQYANTIFNNPGHYHFLNLLMGVFFFAIQIYADFSGYSDIAIGAAKTMGFDLMLNFNRPFESKSVTEYWRRWHISLTTWFNDYLFTPIALDKRLWGKAGVIFAIFITFSISGLWHGAAWTFVLFGVINGIAVIYELLTKKFRKKIFSFIPHFLRNSVGLILTFSFACFTFIFFRSNSFHDIVLLIKHLVGFYRLDPFQDVLRNVSGEIVFTKSALAISFFMILMLFLMEHKISPRLTEFNKKPIADILFISITLSLIVMLGVFQKNSFIYFQF